MTLIFVSESHLFTLSNNISENAGPTPIKFHLKHQWVWRKDICWNTSSLLTKMSGMPIYLKSLLKIFFYGNSETESLVTKNIVNSKYFVTVFLSLCENPVSSGKRYRFLSLSMLNFRAALGIIRTAFRVSPDLTAPPRLCTQPPWNTHELSIGHMVPAGETASGDVKCKWPNIQLCIVSISSSFAKFVNWLYAVSDSIAMNCPNLRTWNSHDYAAS